MVQADESCSDEERARRHVSLQAEAALAAEFERVIGRPVRTFGGHGGLIWVQWIPHEVALYVVEPASRVLREFERGGAVSDEGAMHLTVALENGGAYMDNLDQFPWWKAL